MSGKNKKKKRNRMNCNRRLSVVLQLIGCEEILITRLFTKFWCTIWVDVDSWCWLVCLCWFTTTTRNVTSHILWSSDRPKKALLWYVNFFSVLVFSPYDYFLFPKIKTQLRSLQSDSVEDSRKIMTNHLRRHWQLKTSSNVGNTSLSKPTLKVIKLVCS